jgi:hypothetical protein
VVVWLYLTFIHVTSVFSFPLTYPNLLGNKRLGCGLAHQRSSSSLQHLGYSPSASAFSLLIITTIPDFTILEFIVWTTKLRK